MHAFGLQWSKVELQKEQNRPHAEEQWISRSEVYKRSTCGWWCIWSRLVREYEGTWGISCSSTDALCWEIQGDIVELGAWPFRPWRDRNKLWEIHHGGLDRTISSHCCWHVPVTSSTSFTPLKVQSAQPQIKLLSPHRWLHRDQTAIWRRAHETWKSLRSCLCWSGHATAFKQPNHLDLILQWQWKLWHYELQIGGMFGKCILYISTLCHDTPGSCSHLRAKFVVLVFNIFIRCCSCDYIAYSVNNMWWTKSGYLLKSNNFNWTCKPVERSHCSELCLV